MNEAREFKIKITGDASGISGAARQGAESLNTLSSGTKSYIEKLKEQGRASDEAEVSHRNLRFGLRMMSPELAEAGHAFLASFANPMTAGFIGISILMGKLIEQHQKLKAALESETDLSKMHEVIRTLGEDGLLKAMADASVEAESFTHKLEAIATAQESVKDKTDDAVEALKRQTEGSKEEHAAELKRDLAEVDAKEKLGQLTHDQAESARGRIRSKYEAGDQDAAARLEAQTIEARKKERTEQAAIAGQDISDKQGAATAATAERQKQEGALAEWKKTAEELSKWFKEHGADATPDEYRRQSLNQRLAAGKIAELEMNTLPGARMAEANAKADLETARKQKEEATQRVAFHHAWHIYTVHRTGTGIMKRLSLIALLFLSGCTICTQNRAFPKPAWYWSRDAQLERAARKAQQQYDQQLKQ